MLNTHLEWDENDRNAVFAFEGTAMELSFDRDEQAGLFIENITLEVRRPDRPPASLYYEAGMAFGQIGVFTMGSEPRPVLVFGAYTGGAHCCMDIRALDLTRPDAEVLEIGVFDGGTVAPRDIDADGSYEIAAPDGRFNYTFTAYAGSDPPMQILGLRDGAFRDVTTEPAYHDFLADDFNDLTQACGGDGEWNAGSCAGLLGTAARLGIHDGVRRLLGDRLDSNRVVGGWDTFDFCLDETCEETRNFERLSAAIDHALREWGYLTDQ